MKIKYLGHIVLPGLPSYNLAYALGDCRIILGGPVEREQIGWHFSISCAHRNPTWEEQRDARYEIVPDEVTMVSILPPKNQYVNLHPFCFHWHEAGPKFFNVITGKPIG